MSNTDLHDAEETVPLATSLGAPPSTVALPVAGTVITTGSSVASCTGTSPLFDLTGTTSKQTSVASAAAASAVPTTPTGTTVPTGTTAPAGTIATSTSTAVNKPELTVKEVNKMKAKELLDCARLYGMVDDLNEVHQGKKLTVDILKKALKSKCKNPKQTPNHHGHLAPPLVPRASPAHVGADNTVVLDQAKFKIQLNDLNILVGMIASNRSLLYGGQMGRLLEFMVNETGSDEFRAYRGGQQRPAKRARVGDLNVVERDHMATRGFMDKCLNSTGARDAFDSGSPFLTVVTVKVEVLGDKANNRERTRFILGLQDGSGRQVTATLCINILDPRSIKAGCLLELVTWIVVCFVPPGNKTAYRLHLIVLSAEVHGKNVPLNWRRPEAASKTNRRATIEPSKVNSWVGRQVELHEAGPVVEVCVQLTTYVLVDGSMDVPVIVNNGAASSNAGGGGGGEELGPGGDPVGRGGPGGGSPGGPAGSGPGGPAGGGPGGPGGGGGPGGPAGGGPGGPAGGGPGGPAGGGPGGPAGGGPGGGGGGPGGGPGGPGAPGGPPNQLALSIGPVIIEMPLVPTKEQLPDVSGVPFPIARYPLCCDGRNCGNATMYVAGCIGLLVKPESLDQGMLFDNYPWYTGTRDAKCRRACLYYWYATNIFQAWGKGNRYYLPICLVSLIRKLHPNEVGTHYKGHVV